MLQIVKVVGQLKRKGKMDIPSKKNNNNALDGNSSQIDPDSLLGNPNSKSALDDINGNLVSATSNVGEYTPTEFPLESKLL